jgi:hypothetical protein
LAAGRRVSRYLWMTSKRITKGPKPRAPRLSKSSTRLLTEFQYGVTHANDRSIHLASFAPQPSGFTSRACRAKSQ